MLLIYIFLLLGGTGSERVSLLPIVSVPSSSTSFPTVTRGESLTNDVERERELYLHFFSSGNKDGMNGNEGREEERAHDVLKERPPRAEIEFPQISQTDLIRVFHSI